VERRDADQEAQLRHYSRACRRPADACDAPPKAVRSRGEAAALRLRDRGTRTPSAGERLRARRLDIVLRGLPKHLMLVRLRTKNQGQPTFGKGHGASAAIPAQQERPSLRSGNPSSLRLRLGTPAAPRAVWPSPNFKAGACLMISEWDCNRASRRTARRRWRMAAIKERSVKRSPTASGLSVRPRSECDVPAATVSVRGEGLAFRPRIRLIRRAGRRAVISVLPRFERAEARLDRDKTQTADGSLIAINWLRSLQTRAQAPPWIRSGSKMVSAMRPRARERARREILPKPSGDRDGACCASSTMSPKPLRLGLSPNFREAKGISETRARRSSRRDEARPATALANDLPHSGKTSSR